MLSQTAHRHLEDNQFQALFGEHLNIHPSMDASGWDNVFSILLQLHMCCQRKIHTQDSCHNTRADHLIPGLIFFQGSYNTQQSGNKAG